MELMLAEAEVDKKYLLENKKTNLYFAETDVAVVISSPEKWLTRRLSRVRMPILLTHEARQVIACNIDHKPSYSGGANTLYDIPKSTMTLEDAKETTTILLTALQRMDA